MKIEGKDLKQVKPFQEEKGKFYLLSVIGMADNPLIETDFSNYIVGRSEVGLPTWIWTKDEISPEKVIELESVLEDFLVEGENKFTAKKSLFDLLQKDYKTSDYFEMGYLSCRKPIHPLKGKGVFVRPNSTDKVTLAEYFRANQKEMEQIEVSQSDALDQAEAWIESKKFYVLKDSRGEIVSMAGYSEMEDLAKITHVFTPKEERGKGYCKYLIYSLAKKLLEEGFTPVLYTDYHYKASNKAYQDVGFQDEGILINFKISKEKKKEQSK